MSRKYKDSNSYIYALFKKYYCRDFVPFKIKDFTRREFAFIPFQSKGMIRHIAFNTEKELMNYLCRKTPAHAYYSSAYYEKPYLEYMGQKGWIGADLVFDIDADHINTPCKLEHDWWYCPRCKSMGWGPADVCKKCNYDKIEKYSWVCESCLTTALNHLIRLIQILENDFGLSKKNMEIFFSGHRGFHLHITDKNVINLDQEARREIAEYVMGFGIDLSVFLTKSGKYSKLKTSINSPGWGGRAARELLDLVYSNNFVDIANKLGLSQQGIDTIMKWVNNPYSQDMFELNKKDYEKLLNYIIKNIAVEIDERVTIDTKRLIRLPNSLHGKTGLKVSLLHMQDLTTLRVLNKARVFNEASIRLFAKIVPKKVLDWEFKEYGLINKTIKLPAYIGLYLLLNGGNNFRLISID